MSKKGGGFDDDIGDMLNEVNELSDADLARLLGASDAADSVPDDSVDVENLVSGDRVTGTVVEVREGEVLLDLDGKNLAVIDIDEFPPGEVPEPGTSIQAEFVHYDPDKEISFLSVSEVRVEVLWDELRAGQIVAGRVTEVNKGGLTLNIKGVRAFLPISQIERERVEDLEPYVGRELRCEVTSFDKTQENLVLSRRSLLEREAAVAREQFLATLTEGTVVTGTVVRINDYGAFIDIGGADGLLHISKIRKNLSTKDDAAPLTVGQRLEVVVARIDRDQGRIGLDFHRLAEDSWESLVGQYSVGDEVTGWVARLAGDAVFVALEEGLEARVPARLIPTTDALHEGSLLKVAITAINRAKREVAARPL